MDRRSKLVAAGFLALVCGTASAYVSPSPPPGFGGSPGSWTFTPPTAGQQLGNILRGPGPSVAGSGATSAAFRLGGGAARALAKGVIGGGIAGIAIAGAAWFLENCFQKQGDQWVRTCGGTPAPQADGYEYRADPMGSTQWVANGPDACRAWLAAAGSAYGWAPTTYTSWNAQSGQCLGKDKNGGQIGTNMQRRSSASCPLGWYITPAGCVQQQPVQPVTPQTVEDEMATKPLPQTLPPGFPYPLDPTLPSIWNPTPDNPPTTQPMRVPMGNPVPIPNTNPQLYRQPMSRITSSPTATDPWRMDVQPEDVTSESPTGQTQPQTITSGSPSATPSQDKPDLCEKNPDILACQKFKLGELDALPVPNKDIQVGITPDNGYGPSSGTCPAPRTATILHSVYTFPWTPYCDFASMIRPLLIGFAWLSAALSFMGFARKDS